MYSDPTAGASFESSNGLFPLQGVIEEDELRRPQLIDDDGEPCLIVLKNGCTTGVTIGRATGVDSVVREVLPNGTVVRSMEWAIFPCDSKSTSATTFSAPGDSSPPVPPPPRRSPPTSLMRPRSTGSCSA